jgi:hypothetical protein
MIRMARPMVNAPAAWLPKATRETADAVAAYRTARKEWMAARAKAKARSAKKLPELAFSFKYKVYGDELLRDAVNRVYQYKCAYCESNFGATQPVAIEHYRPKGEVIEGTVRVKPGYYWLAATWENLLPSCTDCNSPRRQVVASDGAKAVRGKGNYFPLEPGTKRASAPGKEAGEKPLLLHPEVDDPALHLEFVTDLPGAGIIRPSLIGGQQSLRGTASIEVYALDRPQLQERRRAHAKRLLSHIRNTKLTERAYRANPNDHAAKRDYDENMKDLGEFLLQAAEYCAMSRQIAKAAIPGLAL